MVILLKHTLRNIFKKPLRSLVIIFCMMVTCFTAYMMLDMTGAIEGIIINYTADMLGNTDVEIMANRNIPAETFEEFPANTALAIYGSGYKVATRNPEQYSYEFLKDMRILGVDLEKAYKMGVFSEQVELSDQETGVSKTYAEDFGLKVGDEVSLYDENGLLHDYTVKYIFPEEGVFIQKGSYTAVVNPEAMKVICGKDQLKSSDYLIDVLDDGQINAFCQYLEDNYPTYRYERIKGNEQIQQSIAQVTSIFVVLFAVTFLMVIFVTMGLSERIICERMAVIGTFKSLGISNRATTLILLLENASYGLIGAVLGSLLYGVIRDPVLGSMLVLADGTAMRIDPMQTWVHLVVFGGAILIQCICPVFELTKAVKTAIRDIIFSNKDTEYRLSRKKVIAGAVLAVLSLLLLMIYLNSNGVIVILCMVMLVVALSFLMPLILKGISKLLTALFEKIGFPTASLAAREIGSKKSTVANGVLCVTVASLAIAIYALSGAMMNMYSQSSYDADIIGLGFNNKEEYYSFIQDLPGVSQVVNLYSTMEEPDINGNHDKVIYDIMAIPQGDLFQGVELPKDLAKNEFLMSDVQAGKLGLAVGDMVEITFKTSYLFPITKTLRFAGAVNSVGYETIPMIFLTEDVYIDIYHNNINGFLVRCEDPDSVKASIEKYALDDIQSFYTREEYQESLQKESQGLMAVLYGIIVLGTILTLIGISGNQVIGFESRKREYAVMHSTAMTKGQIRKLIFLETLFSMGAGILIAIFSGRFINFLLERAVYAIGLPLKIETTFGAYVKMGMILLVVLLFTCRSPLKALRKMNTAQELKYE